MGRTPVDAAVAAVEAQSPEEGLAAVAALRARLDELETLHVEKALRAGWSWRQVAEVLGVTKQAVHKKHARRLADKLAAETAAERKRLIVTGAARQAVRFARNEAEALGAARLRPEHLLLGLLRSEGPVREALAAAGVSLEPARAAVRTLPREPGEPVSRTPGERLPVGADARAVLEQSLREAVRRRDGHLGLEHLLLSLLHAGGPRSAALLEAFDVDAGELERLVDERLAAPV